jgi:myo-inositol-1(or 4)-monophosphatase
MDLKKIMEKTISISKEAGEFIRNEKLNFDLDRVEQKGFNDLVSYVDKQAEQIIVDQLKGLVPEAGFITEEGTNTTRGETYNWIVDPLDGTTNFIHGIPVYSVSIALQENSEIILGVVYEVNSRECFHAFRRGGAYCNETPIGVSSSPELASSLLATGFPYNGLGRIDAFLEILKSLTEKSHGFRRLGSAAVDLCYVACGRVDGYFQHNLNAYDVAGGSIIVKEAGGKITDFEGGKDYIFGGEIVASNPYLHSKLLSEINKSW